MPKPQCRIAAPIVLFLIALAIRSYRLSSNPLWFDELYGYQLGQAGLAAILRSSRSLPLPPLSYLVLWAGAGFGAFSTEWGWRWLSVATGSLSVPLVYTIARSRTSTYSALLAGLLFALSPAHIYYSQESRPYALLTFLAALTSWLVIRIVEQRAELGRWVGLGILSVLGVWISYSFVLVAGMQILFLAIILRFSVRTLLYAGAVLLGCLPLVVIGLVPLQEMQARSAHETLLDLTSLLKMLFAGDFLRYGTLWPHVVVPPVLGALVSAGIWRAARGRGQELDLYHALQVVLPLFGYYAIGVPLVGLTVPAYEWKQFLIILPSIFVLVALGIEQLGGRPFGRVGQIIAVGLCLLTIVADSAYMQRYWTTTKSPEGLAALAVRDRIAPDDAVVSLHYSLDAATSFYLPEHALYTSPRREGDTYTFSRTPSVLLEEQDKLRRDATPETIRRHRRIWILTLPSTDQEMMRSLLQGCNEASRQAFRPFQVLLLQECRRP